MSSLSSSTTSSCDGVATDATIMTPTRSRTSFWEVVKRSLLSCCGVVDGCERHYGRMKCTCMEASPSPAASYERLPSVPTLLELSELCARDDSEEKDTSNEKEEELVFYNDDGSCQSVVVEKNLCASDLCQLLALKNRVAKDVNWTIVEHLVELGLERSLEDHEDVLAAHHDSESYGKHSKKRFVYRKDFRKYEFFHNPQQFFPADMVDLNSCHQLTGSNAYNKTLALQTLLTHSGECPPIFSQVWVRAAGNQRGWNKAFLLLKDRTLFLSYKVQVVAKILRAWKTHRDSGDSSGDSSPNLGEKKADGGELLPFAHLSECHVYTTLNARNQLRAPTEFGICLVPAAGSAVDGEPEQLQCLACESERARLCWVTAMRLAKYGKQLRENYRAFKSKQADASSPKEYNSFTVPHESVRSRVAMDFTGSVGRIVDDPAEAKAIAAAEGHLWKRRLRVPQARPAAPIVTRGLEAGVHVAQPWFHAGMTREQATRLVSKHGTVDGVFLVRESRSSPGAFVLTFKCGPKVLHTQVQPVVDTARDAVCFSLDGGATKFYDLLQLVEFYQLNAGVLATRLTHYVVQSPTGPIYRDKRPPT